MCGISFSWASIDSILVVLPLSDYSRLKKGSSIRAIQTQSKRMASLSWGKNASVLPAILLAAASVSPAVGFLVPATVPRSFRATSSTTTRTAASSGSIGGRHVSYSSPASAPSKHEKLCASWHDAGAPLHVFMFV